MAIPNGSRRKGPSAQGGGEVRPSLPVCSLHTNDRSWAEGRPSASYDLTPQSGQTESGQVEPTGQSSRMAGFGQRFGGSGRPTWVGSGPSAPRHKTVASGPSTFGRTLVVPAVARERRGWAQPCRSLQPDVRPVLGIGDVEYRTRLLHQRRRLRVSATGHQSAAGIVIVSRSSWRTDRAPRWSAGRMRRSSPTRSLEPVPLHDVASSAVVLPSLRSSSPSVNAAR